MPGQHVQLFGASSRALAKSIIDQAPKGALVTIKAAKRSDEQNAKMWALLSDISRAKPEGRKHTPDVWKALFMNACGHAVQFETGLDGRPFPLGFHSSALDKEQMSELITFILQWGDEKGVRWSNEGIAA
jgi:hypothetical protein